MSKHGENTVAAEHAFLHFAKKWQAKVTALPEGACISREADLLSFCCLLLAVEWGEHLSRKTHAAMRANRQLARRSNRHNWYDSLAWDLCLSSRLKRPYESRPVEILASNLNHHNSRLRYLMMELGWFATPWLTTEFAVQGLLKNVADTLAWPDLAAGLAAKICEVHHSDRGNFFDLADLYTAPDRYEDQYKMRCALFKKEGIVHTQLHFWKLESECRMKISGNGLGYVVSSPPQHVGERPVPIPPPLRLWP